MKYTVTKLPRTPYWDTLRGPMRRSVRIRGMEVDDSQPFLGGSGVMDSGIFERYEDFQAEWVNRFVNQPESASYGESADWVGDIPTHGMRQRFIDGKCGCEGCWEAYWNGSGLPVKTA